MMTCFSVPKTHRGEDPWSAQRAMLFRFAVAPAFRTYCIGLEKQTGRSSK